MKTNTIISIVLLISNFSFGQVKSYEDYIIIHPNWSLGDSVQFIGTIENQGIENEDSLYTVMNVEYTMVVEQIDSLGNYKIKCNTGSSEMLSNLKEFGIVEQELPKLEIPQTKLIVDKWGYPKSISNIDELENTFQNFFEKILTKLNNTTTPKQRENAKEYFSQFKGKKLESVLIQSFTAVFLPYDKIFKTSQTIDSTYSYLGTSTEPTLITQLVNINDAENLTISSEINYDEYELKSGSGTDKIKMEEYQTISISKKSTWLNKLDIIIKQRFGKNYIESKVKYIVKNNSM